MALELWFFQGTDDAEVGILGPSSWGVARLEDNCDPGSFIYGISPSKSSISKISSVPFLPFRDGDREAGSGVGGEEGVEDEPCRVGVD